MSLQKKRAVSRGVLLWWILAAAWVGFIFWNSLQPAAESSKLSGSVMELVRSLLRQMGFGGEIANLHFIIRKMAHFTEYAVLGVLIRNAVKTLPPLPGNLLGLLIGAAIPLIDETIQLSSPGRAGQIADSLLDMSGFAAGFLLAWLAGWLAARRRR